MPKVDIELSVEQIQFLTTVAMTSQYQHLDRLVGELVNQFKYSFETMPRSEGTSIAFPSTDLLEKTFVEPVEAGTDKQDTGADVVICRIRVQIAPRSDGGPPAYPHRQENG